MQIDIQAVSFEHELKCIVLHTCTQAQRQTDVMVHSGGNEEQFSPHISKRSKCKCELFRPPSDLIILSGSKSLCQKGGAVTKKGLSSQIRAICVSFWQVPLSLTHTCTQTHTQLYLTVNRGIRVNMPPKRWFSSYLWLQMLSLLIYTAALCCSCFSWFRWSKLKISCYWFRPQP